MENMIERQKQALILAERIIELDPDQGSVAYAMKLREHLKLPMSVVLEKLWPTLSITEKVRRLGVTRQAYYGWLSGIYRPEGKLAHRIADVTGYDVEDVRGRLPARR